MPKKIFAIGGGKDYEIYREMLNFMDIKRPQVLIIPHAQALEKQQGNYDRMYNILVQGFGCTLKILKSNELGNFNKVKELLHSSDIIYVCEGNTIEMLKIWKEYSFDELLKEEWEKGKLMAGTSSGANCWFSSFTTEVDNNLHQEEGLGFIDTYLSSHGQKCSIANFHKESLKNSLKLGILLTNGTALAILDDKCKFVIPNNAYLFDDNKKFATASYYQGNIYFEKIFYSSSEYEQLGKSLVRKLK